ncbi:MAG: DUF3187 family protein [Granulosicoccus sp.]|nr:DUF3187 family protein [Granulosicoccus sp.]
MIIPPPQLRFALCFKSGFTSGFAPYFTLCFASYVALCVSLLLPLQANGSERIASQAPRNSSGPPLDFLQAKGPHSLDGLFGIPSALPAILPSDHLSLSFSHSNMFAAGIATDAALVLDGERSRLSLSWTHVWSTCLRTALELPVVAHAGGYFDSAIETWHDVFGLPNASREDTPADLLGIAYLDPSGEFLQRNSAVAEHGDMLLSVLWSLQCSQANALARDLPVLRAGLKLPTGRVSALTGSGKPDLFVDVTGTTRHWGAWSGRAAAGFLLPGRSEGFSAQEKLAAFGTLAFGWQLTEKFKPVVQIDWHSALFDINMRELGSFTALATVGFQWRHTNGITTEFGLMEDIVPDTAPDIGMHLGLRYGF